VGYAGPALENSLLTSSYSQGLKFNVNCASVLMLGETELIPEAASAWTVADEIHGEEDQHQDAITYLS
jgi:hypothetical protein